MKLNSKAIPQGTRTYLFEEAAHKRFMEHAIHSVLRSRGFQEIVTPPIEYYESMIAGLNEEERSRVIWFTEGETGRIVALRADITSQVARSAATHLSERPQPLRLCYTGAVFRKARTGKGERYVLHQSGMEIIGSSSGAKADIEVILAAVASLKEARLKEISISLGHAAFSASLLKGLKPAYLEPIKDALRKKDKTSLKKHLKESGLGNSGRAQKIIAMTQLYGGGEVLRKAAKLCVSNIAGKEALKNLTAIYNATKKAHPTVKLSIDLGEMRGFGYYSGVIFEVFSASGQVIGSGGRYDNLVKRFGPDSPAVGFAFDIDGMIETFQRGNDAPLWRASDVLLLGANDKADEMRSAGLMVTTPFESMSDSRAKSYARKMNIPYILGKTSGGSYNLVNVASGEKRKCGLSEFINGFFK